MMPLLFRILLTVWMWVFRYTHVALDTLVLYGVLREKNIDGRASGGGISSGGSGGSNYKSGPLATFRSGPLANFRSGPLAALKSGSLANFKSGPLATTPSV